MTPLNLFMEPNNTRKPVQVAVTRMDNSYMTQCNYIIVTLCDDGTVWEMADTRPEWRQLPEIPQDN